MRGECVDIFLLQLFGPEGVGAVVGDADVISRIRATLYSGGSQIQGAQALEVLRGLVFAPDACGAGGVSERLLALLNGGAVAEVKSAVIANAQSKVLIVEFHQPIAARVLKRRRKLGALPYPVGAESKYEIRRSFIDFPERFVRRIHNSNIASDSH